KDPVASKPPRSEDVEPPLPRRRREPTRRTDAGATEQRVGGWLESGRHAHGLVQSVIDLHAQRFVQVRCAPCPATADQCTDLAQPSVGADERAITVLPADAESRTGEDTADASSYTLPGGQTLASELDVHHIEQTEATELVAEIAADRPQHACCRPLTGHREARRSSEQIAHEIRLR